jgi:glycine oxidase
MHHPDVCIAGAGIIGLSLALELHRRGLHVTVLDRAVPLAEASTAAAGMLAAHDPHNPAGLQPLADLSLSLYPAFLHRLGQLSGIEVPCQTHAAIQKDVAKPRRLHHALGKDQLDQLLPGNTLDNRDFYLIDEQSVDPRQLAIALLIAVQATSIQLLPNTSLLAANYSEAATIAVSTSAGTIDAATFVDCTGAWAASGNFPVVPVKGQMLAVSLPTALPLEIVLRTPDIYIVPRTSGPNVGRAIIGATIEDAGFDKTVHLADIAHLRSRAAALLPSLAAAPQLEAWAGLRPATPDGLPLLGALPGHPNHLLATGHYRDGILLAPATALLMAQVLSGETPSIDLTPFSPMRTALQRITP